MSNVFTRGLSRISQRKKKRRELPAILESSASMDPPMVMEPPKGSVLGRGMDRLRRSIRQSFRKQRHSENPSQLVSGTLNGHDHWQPDEGAVRAGVCAFNVKYLGCVEVLEARGMPVCEGGLKMLRSKNRKPVKAILYVSGDGLRVVDAESNRGLMVDQTIEKVSFCAPDRNNDKGFAYICRDGTSRRWMCHGFHAVKDSGERLSHAVGCAFQICFEKKKKQDEEPVPTYEKAVNPDWGDSKTPEPAPPLQRSNPAYQTFRKQISITERLQDPQAAIVNSGPTASSSRVLPAIAKPRPAANPALFQRQGSLRAPESSTNAQFRRNLSLRAGSVDTATSTLNFGTTLHNEPIYEGDEEQLTSVTAPPTTTHVSANPGPSHQQDFLVSRTTTSPILTTTAPSQQGLLSPSEWSMFETTPTTPALSPQPLYINTTSSSVRPTEVPLASNRSKADEWLEQTLRTSLSLSSPPPIMTPSPSLQGINANTDWPGVKSSNGINHAPVSSSGPPPAMLPPPLPSKNPIASAAPVSTVPWDQVVPQKMPKPEDPFDIQWSQLTISNTNPFLEHSRITT